MTDDPKALLFLAEEAIARVRKYLDEVEALDSAPRFVYISVIRRLLDGEQ